MLDVGRSMLYVHLLRVYLSTRLADGALWPTPVCLDVDRTRAESLTPGQPVSLTDEEGSCWPSSPSMSPASDSLCDPDPQKIW